MFDCRKNGDNARKRWDMQKKAVGEILLRPLNFFIRAFLIGAAEYL